MWNNREQHGQKQQRKEKARGHWRRTTSCSGRTQPQVKIGMRMRVLLCTPCSRVSHLGPKSLMWVILLSCHCKGVGRNQGLRHRFGPAVKVSASAVEDTVFKSSLSIIIIIAFGPYLSIGHLRELSRKVGQSLKLSPGVTHPLYFDLRIAAPGVSWAAPLSLSLIIMLSLFRQNGQKRGNQCQGDKGTLDPSAVCCGEQGCVGRDARCNG